MYIMAAHEMMTLGAAVTGTVDPTYFETDLCDGYPDTPVRVDSGSLSLAITGTSQPINALIIANHNMLAGDTAAFSGLGTVTMPAVPPGGIRFNGLELLTSPATAGSTTLTASTSGPIIIGEAIAGLFRSVWTLPPEVDHDHRGFSIMPDAEFPTLGYTKGGQARRFGGSVWLDDIDYLVLRDAWLASEENALPTVIVPLPDEVELDPWVVFWETFNPRPGPVPNTWLVDVAWQELPRYRWRT
jgi:hypothetical protein